MMVLARAPRFRRFILTLAALAACSAHTPQTAAQETMESGGPNALEQESLAPQTMRGWFRSLRVPGTKVSCCDESDCKRTKSRIGPAGYEAMAPDGRWISIPESAILRGKPNLAREPVLCLSPTQAVYCFVPDNEG